MWLSWCGTPIRLPTLPTLLTREQCEPQREEFCRLVGKSADPGQCSAAALDELNSGYRYIRLILGDYYRDTTWG
ncbi:hypothetical protein ACWEO2_38895 [Nocardia sp. NPDC004278]